MKKKKIITVNINKKTKINKQNSTTSNTKTNLLKSLSSTYKEVKYY
jgi:hypothetical protein